MVVATSGPRSLHITASLIPRCAVIETSVAGFHRAGDRGITPCALLWYGRTETLVASGYSDFSYHGRRGLIVVCRTATRRARVAIQRTPTTTARRVSGTGSWGSACRVSSPRCSRRSTTSPRTGQAFCCCWGASRRLSSVGFARRPCRLCSARSRCGGHSRRPLGRGASRVATDLAGIIVFAVAASGVVLLAYRRDDGRDSKHRDRVELGLHRQLSDQPGRQRCQPGRARDRVPPCARRNARRCRRWPRGSR